MNNVVVCIGDSVTAGQFVQPHQAWPRLLYGYDVLPAGVPGDTTRLALERFPVEVQAISPKAVVIQFGHNDCNRWASDRGLFRVSLDAFEANIVEMVERCRVFDALPFLCTLTPTFKGVQYALDTERFDRLLRRSAILMKVTLIDVREDFGVLADGLTMKDGVHLTVEGHRRYAAVVQKTLDGWLR